MDDSRYTELATAIIWQAAEDYRENRRTKSQKNSLLRKTRKQLVESQISGDETGKERFEKKCKSLRRSIQKIEGKQKEIETFFLSSWFKMLSESDGRAIMARLKKERIRKAKA